jgi:TIR domain
MGAPVGFEHGCFISYVNPREEMMEKFIGSLVPALKGELEPLLGTNAVYVDRSGLQVGDNHEPVLGRGMCASACWMLIYVPQYAEHPYCRREFLAMQILQDRRRELGLKLPPQLGMILPVLLRGNKEELPNELRETIALEFTKHTVASPEINTNEEVMEEIRELAEHIREVYEHGRDFDQDCTDFNIPPDDEGGSRFNRLQPRFPKL